MSEVEIAVFIVVTVIFAGVFIGLMLTMNDRG
jgi:hypothetical protein